MGTLYDGDYQRIAPAIRAQAYANPATRCRRCGKTLADKPGDSWDVGHPDPGQSGFAPEHASCNRSAGARKRNGTAVPTTQQW